MVRGDVDRDSGLPLLRHRAIHSVVHALICGFVVIAPPGVSGADLVELGGPAVVIDGDSMTVGSTEIRLEGIDAPEWNQKCWRGDERWDCGRASTDALKAMVVNSAGVRCVSRWTDRYGRRLATCKAGAVILNERMVRDGWALAYRYYSGAYIDAEHEARREQNGIWTSQFVRPWKWRRGVRIDFAETVECPVKGNVNSKGQRIYHVRGSRHYGRVKIRPEQGDRCFDSEAAATQAGFRPPAQ